MDKHKLILDKSLNFMQLQASAIVRMQEETSMRMLNFNRKLIKKSHMPPKKSILRRLHVGVIIL